MRGALGALTVREYRTRRSDMNHPLTPLTAQMLQEDARRAGERRAWLLEAEAQMRSTEADAAITIRQADWGDSGAVTRLAAHLRSEVPPRPVLLAEVDGRLCAALSLVNGWSVADPLQRSAGVLELLSLRAIQLRGEPSRGGFFRRLLRRRTV